MTRDEARAQILEVIGQPRTIAVSRELWLAAAVLGGLRQAVNDTLRSRHRDRGDTKNALGDMQGCFGELFLASLLESELVDAVVSFTPSPEAFRGPP